jgi:hypothetical protein
MNEIEKYLKYKNKYMNLKKNINFYPIDLVLDNLGAYYKIIKQQYELHSGGGTHQESTTDSSVPKNSDKKYYKKYKNLITSSAQSIGYYKNLIQLQMSNQMKLNNYYQNLVGVLKSQRDRLATGYQVLGNDFKNEKEKISMLETMITGLEKYVQSSKDLDINVKKITLKGGGAMSYDQFQDMIMTDMTELSNHIQGIDDDKNFLEGKITELHKRMNDIVTQNEQLFKIKAEVEWIVNQMENVDDGADKAGQQEFDDLYNKIKGMIDTAKSKGTISKNISDYVHKLEEYASYLENFIKTNDKTLGSIKLEKRAPINDAVVEKKGKEDNLKTVASALTELKVGPVAVVEDVAAIAQKADDEYKAKETEINEKQKAYDAKKKAVNAKQKAYDEKYGELEPTYVAAMGEVTKKQTALDKAAANKKAGAQSALDSAQGKADKIKGENVIKGKPEKDALDTEKEALDKDDSALNADKSALVILKDAADAAKAKLTAPLDQTSTNTGTATGAAGTAPLTGSKLVNNQLGGSNFAKLIGGGSFIDEYNKRSESMIEKLKKLFENQLTNVEIENSVFILDSLGDKSDKKFPVFFGKLATMSGLLIKLDTMLNDYNKLYEYLKNNPSLLRHDASGGYDLVELWKDIFKAKKTEYYTEKLLKFDIYFYNYLNSTDKTITLEDALRNLPKADETSKITIKIADIDDVKNNIDSILTNLDNTVISVDHLIFFIENMVLTFIQGTKELGSESEKKEKEDSIKSLELRIQQRRDRLLKSAFVNTSAVYSVLYGQTGGGLEIVLPNEPLPYVEAADKNIFLELFRLYSSSILVPSEKSPMTVTNQKQIERTIQLTYMMMALYDKINLKLGSTDDKSMFAALTEKQKQIKNYSQFDELIKKLDEETKPQIIVQVEDGKTQLSEITKPRLDIYRDRLVACRNELKPYMKNIAILRNVLFETKTGTFPTEETKILIGLYNNVKKQIEEGINSYIKLIPMIFFTIEFPPAVYATQKCKYKFTFDAKKELVEYKFIEGQNKADCNDLGLGDFDEKEFAGVSINSHAAFFESNKLNGTKKLIDDPVIGLGKLIKQDENGSDPISATINMMFALGASGTGKTTRYFGKSNGHPDDKEGIVPFIINKSLEDAKTADPNAPPTKKISIAYFVCYGQKTLIDSVDAGFNELVIFFNIDEINKSNGGDATVGEDSKYIPYYMPKSTTVISEETANKYTNFYSSIVSKKLERKTYSELKGFITNGESFPTLKPGSEQKTFRELVESTPIIWKEVNPAESSAIGDLFENLIIEQKKINTVLPTKNNIESSRGHTCVLVKIEDTDPNVKTNKVKYFPLFDMAGTENTGQIDIFLKEGRNKDKMAKLVQKVNTVTQSKDILRADDETKQYPSLNDLLKYDNISKWVGTKNKYLTIESVGGGKSKIKVEDFYNQELVSDASAGPGENFLNKVVKEGYYINHTISMLIFAAMCVGSSLRTEVVNTSGMRTDKFDDFFPSLFTEIDKFTCIPSATGTADCVGKTMMLLAKKSAGAIVNGSCIWLQVLFSFLYWNEETPKSITKWLQNITADTTDALTYLCEPEVQKSEIKTEVESGKQVGVMTVEQLYKVGKVSDPADGLSKLYALMLNINKTHKFTSGGQQVLENEVSLVSVNAGNLKIEYQPKGGAKTFISSPVELDLTTKPSQKEKDYQIAFDIRKKLGLSDENAKKKYPVPTSNKYSPNSDQYKSYDKLDPATKEAYVKVQNATEYKEPEKVKATGKIYWDFFEIPGRTQQLNDFKSTLKTFLNGIDEDTFNLKMSETVNIPNPNYNKTIDGRKDTRKSISNPEYKLTQPFRDSLAAIAKKIKDENFFNTTTTTSKTPSTTLPEPPLVESFKYDLSSEDFGPVEPFALFKKENHTYKTLKNMLAVLDNIEKIRKEKEDKEASEKATFVKIPDVIVELNDINKIPQADLASIKNLLEITGGKLKLYIQEEKKEPKEKFYLFTKEGALIPIYQVIKIIDQFPTLPVCPTDPSSLNKLIAENQMHRIRDGRAAATKMTLMHLVTGQGIKHYMVEQTMQLCKTLYESTNLDLSK